MGRVLSKGHTDEACAVGLGSQRSPQRSCAVVKRLSTLCASFRRTGLRNRLGIDPQRRRKCVTMHCTARRNLAAECAVVIALITACSTSCTRAGSSHAHPPGPVHSLRQLIVTSVSSDVTEYACDVSEWTSDVTKRTGAPPPVQVRAFCNTRASFSRRLFRYPFEFWSW